jgi:acetoacetyl-CoA synthetase
MTTKTELGAGRPTPIWTPSAGAVERSAMTAFTRHLENVAGRSFQSYSELHRFSIVENRLFWRTFLEWSEITCEGDVEPVRMGDDCETAEFFPGLRLNYAENLLKETPQLRDDAPALLAISESGERLRMTRGELRARVLGVAQTLRNIGIGPNDRVAALARNQADAVVAALAAAALGAIWSSVSPDMGADLVLTRFGQLEPRLLLFHGEFAHHGVRRSVKERGSEVAQSLPTSRKVMFFEELDPDPSPLPSFTRFPFSQPLFVLYSSGTTGPPKSIVHGAGGTLLEHFNEHRLHTDLGPGDRMLFVTTAGWMMWNWMLSALASGVEIVLLDGSPTFPEADSLWRIVEEERITVLGTSAAYLQYCRDADLHPGRRDLDSLRAILSTGSVLDDALYPWVKERVKDLPLQSISGGTDILGCFVLGNPNLPVDAGESQCLSLGMDVRMLGAEPADGSAVSSTDRLPIGELVCANPFPSRPIGFLSDPDRSRYHEAYFSQNPGYWTHGDLITITDRGTARIHGRSDGVLNIRGNRVGPAEIYRVLQDFPEIGDALAIEQKAPREAGSRLVLLVMMKNGAALDRPLQLRIKKELSTRASAAHIPAVIAQVAALPMTHNRKRSERAARDVLNGRAPANRASLANPECLDEIARHPDLLRPGS